MLIKLMVGYVFDSGCYGSWSKDDKHRAEAERYGVFREIWPDRKGPFPWRLTKEERQFLDERMKSVVWPHYVDRLAYRGHSFWSKPNRLWKTKRKLLLLYFMLPTQIRDHLPKLRKAINTFVWAMRRLDGQVHCHHVAKNLGVLPGSRTIRKSDIQGIHRDLIRGLCLLEGCIPTTHLNPALHHFVHYAQFTLTHGPLRKFWMFVFERYNKHIKGLCRNPECPEVSLSHAVSHDVSSRFLNLAEEEQKYDVNMDLHHNCVLSSSMRHFIPTRKQLGDLRYIGCDVGCLTVTGYSVAHIMGVQFRAGEWGQSPRCGSVITCVVGGRSLYARVDAFVRVDGEEGPGYALVQWFGQPEYPEGTPLVVRVPLDGSEFDDDLLCVVRITSIDPSRVMFEMTTHDKCYMMRDSGYDTLLRV